MKTAISFSFVLVLWIINYSIAQQENDLWTNFTTADGLCSTQITSIIESSDGSIWVGTSNGLNQYYEGKWKSYTLNDGLIDNYVVTICEANDGALWFGTPNGASQYWHGNWKSYTTNNGLADDNVKCIIKTRNGALWFATSGGGVNCFQNGTWSNYTTANGLVDNNVNAICESSDGALWFGTYQGGVSRYYQGEWITYNTANTAGGLASFRIYAIYQSSDKTMWFGTHDNGVSRLRDGKWTTFNKDSGLAGSSVYAITESSDGALWFGTNGGASSLQYGVFKNYTIPGFLLNHNVEAIIQASDGALWFGTLGGLSRYEKAIWTTFTSTSTGLAGDCITAIFESTDGAMWFGTYQPFEDYWPGQGKGVSRYYNGAWHTYTTSNTDSGLTSNTVRAIYQTDNGVMWFGTSEGVCTLTLATNFWQTYTTADGLADNNIYTIFEANDKALWVGTSNGVSEYRNEKWKSYRTSDGLAGNYVYSVCQSKDGVLWFGTNNGVSRLENNNWKTYTTTDGLIHNTVYASAQSDDGDMWFGTEDGVSRFDQIHWRSYTEADGLAGKSNRAILKAKDGALWFASAGITRYKEDKWLTFTYSDGLIRGYIGTIFEAKDGGLWFGSNSKYGVSRLEPDKIPPFTFILEAPSEQVVSIPTQIFVFAGKDYRTNQDQLLYSYAVTNATQLPNESDWSAFIKSTSIQTPPLKTGLYTFQVRAKDEWQNIDPTPTTWTYMVDITPPTITILSPRINDIIAGEVAIIGSTYDNSPIQDFSDYELSYAPSREDTTRWLTDRFFYQKATTAEIRDDTLAIWRTTGLPTGAYWLHLSARDKLGHVSHDFVPVEVVRACQLIDARHGGYLCTESHKIEIYIPPNAIPKDKQINVKDFSLQQIDPIQNPAITFLGLCFEITPQEIQLSKPGTIALIYPDSLTYGKNEEKLALYHSHDGKSNWQRLGGSVNLEDNKITTSFRQFGIFALYEDLTEGGKAGIFNVNSQPRIFSPQGGGYDTQTAISFELGKESNVTIKIYNPAGRLIKVLMENQPISHGNNVVHWDGKDQDGKLCVSGLYIVTIQAEEKMATKTVVVLNK